MNQGRQRKRRRSNEDVYIVNFFIHLLSQKNYNYIKIIKEYFNFNMSRKTKEVVDFDAHKKLKAGRL